MTSLLDPADELRQLLCTDNTSVIVLGRVDAWLHALRLPGAAARHRSLAPGASEDALGFLEGVLVSSRN